MRTNPTVVSSAASTSRHVMPSIGSSIFHDLSLSVPCPPPNGPSMPSTDSHLNIAFGGVLPLPAPFVSMPDPDIFASPMSATHLYHSPSSLANSAVIISNGILRIVPPFVTCHLGLWLPTAVVPLHSLYTLSCEVSSENYQFKVDLASAKDELNHANFVVNQLALELQKTHIQR